MIATPWDERAFHAHCIWGFSVAELHSDDVHIGRTCHVTIPACIGKHVLHQDCLSKGEIIRKQNLAIAHPMRSVLLIVCGYKFQIVKPDQKSALILLQH